MPYSLHQIDSSWVLESEQLGTKDKFWLRATEEHALPSSSVWLFKEPTLETGQHWAEKIAYEISRKMGVLAPRVELAEFNGIKGSITENFTTDNYDLFHGNQILAGSDSSYEPGQRFSQNDHTLERIIEALRHTFPDDKFSQQACQKFASYLVLDALICNVDRHHENWGVLRKNNSDGTWRGRLAPSFDHASSLGRELKDDASKQKRRRYLDELGIAKYLERGRCPIFMDVTGRHGPSPIRLVERASKDPRFQAFFSSALELIERVSQPDFEKIIAEIPQNWMTDTAREFSLSLLSETHRRLTLPRNE